MRDTVPCARPCWLGCAVLEYCTCTLTCANTDTQGWAGPVPSRASAEPGQCRARRRRSRNDRNTERSATTCVAFGGLLLHFPDTCCVCPNYCCVFPGYCCFWWVICCAVWITVAFGGLFVAFVRITVAFGGFLLQAERRRLPVGHRAARRHRKQALPRPVRVHQCLSESPAGLNRLSVRRRCRSLRVGSSCGAPLPRRRVPHPFACLFVCLFACSLACRPCSIVSVLEGGYRITGKCG